MTEAVIVDAVRTPGGKRNGKLKDWHPVDLSSVTIEALVERNEIDPYRVDDVIWGCVSQTGEQTGNLGKVAGRICDYYEVQLAKKLDALSKLAEPIMLLVMGVVVGVLVSSLILPIFKLSRAVS